MSELELKENWPVEKTKNRIKEINEEIESVNAKLSHLDKELDRLNHKIKQVEKRKAFLDKKTSNNVRYKNAMIKELYEKGEWNNE